MLIAADFLLPGVLLVTARKAGLARATLWEVRTAAQRYSMKGESIPSYLCNASRLGLLLRLGILGCKTVGSLGHLSDCCATCMGQLVVSRASFSIEGINNGFRIADRRKDALLDRQSKRCNLGGTDYIVIFGLSRPAAWYGNTSYEQGADCRIYGLN